MVLLGGWLDLMILEVFSNLWFYDSMILYALQAKRNQRQTAVAAYKLPLCCLS